jgi:RNA recognition motif-containing protein
MTALQSDALASGKKMLAEGFNAMRESIHHVKVLQEMVSQLNLQGQSDNMTWGKEMLADGFRVMQKVHDHVKVLHAMIRPLKLQESDAIERGKEILEDGFKALQKARLHVKELEEIVHQMNILEQYAKENLAATPVEEDPVSVNKKRTFSQQDGEQFINQVLTMETPCEDNTIHSKKRVCRTLTMYALNKQSWDDQLDSMVKCMRDREETPITTMVSETSQVPHGELANDPLVIKFVPHGITESELYGYFRPYGVVRDIDLPRNKDTHGPRYGTIRGFAFIYYETAEQSDRAFRALSTRGLYMHGKKTMISKYNTELRKTTSAPSCESVDITAKSVPDKETGVNVKPLSPFTTMMSETPCVQASQRVKTIIARNVPRNISPEDLHERFRLYGVVHDIYLPRNKDPHSPHYGSIRGFAIIKYETAAQSARAFRALSVTGLSICGKKVTVEFAKSDTATRSGDASVPTPLSH